MANHDTVPTIDQLPSKRGDGRIPLELELEFVTPIFGGGTVTRAIDTIDVIRPPSIRGHLRFWWRALYAQDYSCADDLYSAEMELWGGPTNKGKRSIGRSRVEVRVAVGKTGNAQPADLADARGYVLFPARSEIRGQPHLLVRLPRTQIRLYLRFPADAEQQVRDSLRAWILFGGYGSRTRRGLGSMTVVSEAERGSWLPQQTDVKKSIGALFGRDIFGSIAAAVTVTPRLAGANLYHSAPMENADKAWTVAAGWLREFRQGYQSKDGARQPGDKKRPSLPSFSNWPEPDKIRHLSLHHLPWAHSPHRHNDKPTWPRAGFGLPIVGRFRQKGREDEPLRPRSMEPEPYLITWQSPEGELHDRLASPLIIKPMALADGQFSPIALWLRRSCPDGQVVLCRDHAVVPNSEAPFDRFLAPGDPAYFTALDKHPSLEAAFFAWLKVQKHTSSPKGNNGHGRGRNNHRGGKKGRNR